MFVNFLGKINSNNTHSNIDQLHVKKIILNTYNITYIQEVSEEEILKYMCDFIVHTNFGKMIYLQISKEELMDILYYGNSIPDPLNTDEINTDEI